jgi:F0F1-type ATP synthase gamma subunit
LQQANCAVHKKGLSRKTLFVQNGGTAFFFSISSISGEGVIKLLTGTGRQDTYLVVIVTADRGLCGGFNSNINRATVKYVRSLEDQGKTVKLITMGKKVEIFLPE